MHTFSFHSEYFLLCVCVNPDDFLDSEHFVRYDIIVDATDNVPSRYMINDCCVVLGKVNLNALKYE